MVRVVFFSFDYDDVWRVNQVRNSSAFIGKKRSGFRDKAEYEQVKRDGDAAISSWIRTQMKGCSVTCVLIGAATYKSRWVNFEIKESIANRMGLLGVNIHKLKDEVGKISSLIPPPNPLGMHTVPSQNAFGMQYSVNACDFFETHTWEPSNALSLRFDRQNSLGAWVEEAARRVGR